MNLTSDQRKIKKQRWKLKQPEDYLTHEPYQSIIRILQMAPQYHKIFKKGLFVRELRYLIQKEYILKKHHKKLRIDRLTHLPLVAGLKEYLKGIPNIMLDQNLGSDQNFGHYLKKLQGIWIKRNEKRLCALLEDPEEYNSILNTIGILKKQLNTLHDKKKGHATTMFIDSFLLVFSNDTKQNYLFRTKYLDQLDPYMQVLYDVRDHLNDLNDDVYLKDGPSGFKSPVLQYSGREDNITIVMNMRGHDPIILQTAALVRMGIMEKERQEKATKKLI